VINAFVMFLARAAVLLLPSGSRDGEQRSAPPPMLLVWPLEVMLGLVGSLITAWFSRHREFRADAGAASLTGAGSMVQALQLLGQVSGLRDPHQEPALATLKISGSSGLLGLLASHPPLERRIAALQRLGA
jgi:heat shock protein HtpX